VDGAVDVAIAGATISLICAVYDASSSSIVSIWSSVN